MAHCVVLKAAGRGLLALLIAVLPVTLAPAQSTDFAKSMRQVDAAMAKGDYQSALRIAQSVDTQELAAQEKLALADALLRCGDPERAVKWFDQYVEADPESEPYLWQRGIAYYFTGDFDRGAKQFESHRKVNSYDVENAAWHFLCVAKRDSPAKAKELLLPAPNDPRPPMREVLQMLSDGDTQPVIKVIESQPPGTGARRSAEFYGYFYLGLYADALGKTEQAKPHLERAVKNAQRNYMGDVARVYVKFLADAAK